MNIRPRTGTVLLATPLAAPLTALLTVLPATLLVVASGAALVSDPRGHLRPGAIESVSIHLDSAGADLAWEAVIDGADPQLEALIAVIREARTRGGHKCPNVGSIRFRLAGGGVVGVGLLPSHSPGVYELRIYDGERLVDAYRAYRVDRAALLHALAALGVPTDHPASSE